VSIEPVTLDELLIQARNDYRTLNSLRAELVRVSREAEQLREALNAALSNDFEWWKTAAKALEEGDRQP
jgi:hypothetical protein